MKLKVCNGFQPTRRQIRAFLKQTVEDGHQQVQWRMNVKCNVSGEINGIDKSASASFSRSTDEIRQLQIAH